MLLLLFMPEEGEKAGGRINLEPERTFKKSTLFKSEKNDYIIYDAAKKLTHIAARSELRVRRPAPPRGPPGPPRVGV